MAARPRNGLGRSGAMGEESPERRTAIEESERQAAVVTGIARIFREVLTCTTEEQLYHICLGVAEETTQSRFGFLGEINRRTGLLDSIVISDSGWDACRMENVSRHGERRLPVSLAIHGLYGRVIQDGKGLFTNDPSSHPDSIGTPDGHPPLTAFLGVPLVSAGATIGMVGLANREGGYTAAQLRSVEDLATAIVEAISRKRAERAFRLSEAKYRQLYEGMRDAFVSVDMDGWIQEYNEAYREMLGYEPGELSAFTYMDLTPSKWHVFQAEIIERQVLPRGYSDVYEKEYRRKNGTVVPVELRTILLRNEQGDPCGMWAILRDITERKRHERKIRWLNATLGRRVAERTEAIQVLHDVASVANQAQDAEQVIEYGLQRVAKYSGWIMAQSLMPAADNPEELTCVCFWPAEDDERFGQFRKMLAGMRFRRDEGLPGRVFAGGELVWTTDLRRDMLERRAVEAEKLGIRTAVGFPVLVGERVVAVLEFFSDRVIAPDMRITDVMADVGLQLGRVLERVEFEEHLLTIAEEVRQGIAQDLHDDVGQELTGLELKAATLAEMLAAAEGPAAGLAADIATAVERTHGKVRQLSQGLLPPELEEGLLVAALQRLAAATSTDSRIICTFECCDPGQVLDDRVAIHLYRIAQEAVSNAVRHSRATHVDISLEHENGLTVLRVRDNGMGLLAKEMRPGGMGLRTMRYRAGLIDAKLKVGPCPGGGTQVLCRLSTRKSMLKT